ncbi:HAL/PAL/TAL family ammonia-lyase [Clostridium aminobutyricum]|uniref:Aromatic amino acid lyase n=1 Tax=Clostridium aminobutyricum TaxID=33953 RepID=A0A939D919_CLOAM|nr:aromatic amino acid ammonia-lyase [Clostridium aminobutyricum]MBN7772953.1 aromatic amino acid lyase [Clostridium aminobutyricum]
MNPRQIKTITLDIQNMTLEEFVAISRYEAKVELSPAYCKRVVKSRRLVEKFLDERRIIYGVTTGFGDNYNKIILPEQAVTLQKNILRSHACSLGEPLEKEVVRGILLMMLQNLGQGYSGVQISTLECIVNLLNGGITPFAPRRGSVGYLAVEAHICLVLLGEGKAWYRGELLNGSDALAAAGIRPIQLGCKEGLALVSGTTSVTAIAALALFDAIKAAKTADIAGAMSLEALRGTIKAFDPRIQSVRPHEEQSMTARNVLRILNNSEIADKYKDYRLQDALSLRCIPQLHGAAKKTFKDAAKTIGVEMNSCCDNPIIYPEEDDGIALMGCNADSAYVGIEADSMCIALTNIAKMSERRIDRLINHHVSELPPFLIENSGLNSGFMIPQYTAVGLLGEMRLLSTASTIDNTSTCANQEDYIGMGYNASRKAYQSVQFLENIMAIEFLNAAQALEFLKPLNPSPATKTVYDLIRKEVPKVEDDQQLYPFLEYISEQIHQGEIIAVVEEVIGELEF